MVKTGILSQKEIRRAINNRVDTLTDKEVFLSKAYSDFLSQMLRGVTMEDSKLSSVMFEGSKEGAIAYTDGSTCHIAFESAMTEGHDRRERNLIYTGLNLHESGHVVFTDFKLGQKAQESLVYNHLLYPSVGKTGNDLEDFLVENPGATTPIASLYHRLDNCIEDGFIDRAVCNLCPGYAPALIYVDKTDAADFMSAESMRLKGISNVDIFINLVLGYARHGKKFYEAGSADPVVEAFEDISDLIDKAVIEYSPTARKKLVNEVFCTLFQFIKDEVENQPPQNGGGHGDGQQGEGQSGQGQQGQGQSGGSSGGGQPDSKNPGQEEGQDGSSEGGQSSSQSQGNSDGQSQSQNGQTASSGQNSPSGNGNGTPSGGASTQQLLDAIKNAANNAHQSEKSEHKNPTSPDRNLISSLKKEQNGSKDKKGDKQDGSQVGNNKESDPVQKENKSSADASKDKPSEDENSKDGKKPNGEKDGKDTSADKASDKPNTMDDVLKSICEKAAADAVQKEQEKAIQEELKDMRKDAFKEAPIHHVNSTVVRVSPTSDGKDEYEAKHHDLDLILKRLLKEFEKEIKDRQTGETMTGLYNGKSVTSRELYRFDKRIMSNKILPEDIPDMAVGIVIDCSGSMHGNKIARAKESAYITYMFCQRLSIPCFVIGHDVSCGVELLSVADENSIDHKDAQRIFSLRSGGCNRDGYALWYATKKLEKLQSDQKVLFVISDGRPNDGGYSGDIAKEDMQACVKYGVKHHILTIAAAIDDADAIHHYYKDGVSEKNSAKYLDLSDLDKLPKAFVKILKKMLD